MSETSGSDGSDGTSAPPGWYPDGTGGTRYWDGAAWAPVGEGPPADSAATGSGSVTASYPTYDPNAGSTAPGRSRTGLLIAVVGAVVGLAAIAIVLLLVLGGDDDGPSSADPAATVQSFLDAGQDRDCEAALELLSSNLRDDFVEECDDDIASDDLDELGLDPDDFEYSVGEADVDGDRASVPVTISGTGFGDVTTDYGLVKRDGAWLIDSFGGPDFDEVPELPDDFPTGFDDFEDLPDLPDDFPTDFLEDLMENLPSGFPTDFLTEFPDGFPTDFGDLPTDFPTE